MGNMIVFEVWFSLITARDTVVQPYTGKTVRQILFKLAEATGLEDLYQLLESRGNYKPYSTTPLLAGGRPLIKYRPGPPLVLYGGRSYDFRLTVLTRDPSLADLLVLLPIRINVYDAPAIITLRSAKVFSEENIGLGIRPGIRIKLDFLSPTQLQLPKINKRSKRSKYTQIPEPHLIFFGLRELWNKYAQRKILTAAWRANYSLIPIFLNIKSRVVPYDKRRVITGFTGTIIYKVNTRGTKVLEMLDTLLALSSLIGIGKSRGIGLGYTRVTMLNQSHFKWTVERATFPNAVRDLRNITVLEVK